MLLFGYRKYGLVPAELVDEYADALRALEFTEGGSVAKVAEAHKKFSVDLRAAFNSAFLCPVVATARVRLADDITVSCKVPVSNPEAFIVPPNPPSPQAVSPRREFYREQWWYDFTNVFTDIRPQRRIVPIPFR